MCRLLFWGFLAFILLLVEMPGRGTAQPYVTIGAVFEGGKYTNYSKAFYHAINEYQSGHAGKVKVEGLSLRASDNLYDIITTFCSRMGNSSIEAFVVVGSKSTIHMINMIAGSLGVPVLGYNTQVVDAQSKVSKHTLLFVFVCHLKLSIYAATKQCLKPT